MKRLNGKVMAEPQPWLGGSVGRRIFGTTPKTPTDSKNSSRDHATWVAEYAAL